MADIKELTIGSINDVYVALKEMFDTSDSVRLNLSQVKQADTAGLQLLLALYVECERTDKKIEWIEPSDELVQIAQLLGLQKVLDFETGKIQG